jgi:hypothetical protein
MMTVTIDYGSVSFGEATLIIAQVRQRIPDMDSFQIGGRPSNRLRRNAPTSFGCRTGYTTEFATAAGQA